MQYIKRAIYILYDSNIYLLSRNTIGVKIQTIKGQTIKRMLNGRLRITAKPRR